MKKYKATYRINESWTKEFEALDEKNAYEIANNDEGVLEIYNRNGGHFGIDCDIEEVK